MNNPLRPLRRILSNAVKLGSRTLGSLQMAVVLIALLAAVLSVGTFFESYYSRSYAYNLVYGSLAFRLLLCFLAINILIAALNRLPFKKKLAGFYVSHLGLLILLAGSLLTLVLGIDATLTLYPGEYTHRVRMDEPVLYAQVYTDEASLPSAGPAQIPLPSSIFPQDLNRAIPIPGTKEFSLAIRRFLPYAREKPEYRSLSEDAPGSGLEFTLLAPQVSQKGTLSSPPSQYPESLTLGPLHVLHLGRLAPKCDLAKIQAQLPAARLLGRSEAWLLLTPDHCSLIARKTDLAEGTSLKFPSNLLLEKISIVKNHKTYQLKTDTATYLFFPALSSWPISDTDDAKFPNQLAPNFSAPYRLLNLREILTDKALLFFVKEKTLFVALYDPPQALKIHALDPLKTEPLELPWMKLRLNIDSFHPQAIPYRSFVATKPKPADKDRLSAIAVSAHGFLYWLDTSGEVLQVPLKSRDKKAAYLEAFLGYKTFTLPWHFRLERFKMDTDPGTRTPASYESFVNLRIPGFESMENHHIYMNHPLKKDKYTFYQASYFPLETDSGEAYGSVLQVNHDPGRFLKYLGAGILVLGTSLHFYLRRTPRAPRV